MTSTLNPSLLSEAGLTAGSAAIAAELRKHSANDAKCSELGWTCIPLVVESYGAEKLSKLSQDLLHTLPLYGRLNLTLVRANDWSLLLKGGYIIQEGDISSS